MRRIAVAIYLVVAAGLLWNAYRFGLQMVPAPHHAEILRQDGVEVTGKLLMVLTAIYRAWAGAYLAMGILIAYLALFPIRTGSKSAPLAAALAALAAGMPAAVQSYQVAVASNVSTPWTTAVTLAGLAVLATILAMASASKDGSQSTGFRA